MEKIHPVIQALINRKGLKVPIQDGRKITLVLFGGLMVGARGAGSLVAMQELGLTDSFDEIYTMSSGFVNGSGFLSEQSQVVPTVYYNKLSGLKFLNPLKVWQIANIKYLFKIIKEHAINFTKILEGNTKLYSMLINLSKNEQPEYLEVHNFPENQYFNIIKASCSLRFLAGGKVQIGDDYYRDIIKERAIYDFFAHILESSATDIFVVYNYSWQKEFIHKKFPQLDKHRIYEFYPEFDESVFKLFPKFARFDTRRSVLKEQCQIFGNETKKIFGSTEPIKLL